MKKECWSCKRTLEKTLSGLTPFDFNSVTVLLRNREHDECDLCLIDHFYRRLAICGEDFLFGESSSLKVNWGMYDDAKRQRRGEEKIGVFNALLESIGILSIEPQGNWQVMAHGGINCNPSSPFLPYYFTRREDVLVYARLEMKSAQYPWKIFQYGEVIKASHRFVSCI